MKIQSIQFKHISHFTDLQLQLHPQQQPVALILGNQSSVKPRYCASPIRH